MLMVTVSAVYSEHGCQHHLKSISSGHTALDSIAIRIASESYFPASHI